MRSAGFMVVGVNHTLKLRELTWTHVSPDESILIMCPVQANRPTTMIGRTRVSILATPRTCRPSQSIYQSAGSSLSDVVNQSSESFHQHESIHRTKPSGSSPWSAGEYHNPIRSSNNSNTTDRKPLSINPDFSPSFLTAWHEQPCRRDATCNM